MIEAQIDPSVVSVLLNRDGGKTGNFELTLYNSKNTGGKLLHSKKGGDGFLTANNMDTFITKLSAEI